jgi:hypothetical protein
VSIVVSFATCDHVIMMSDGRVQNVLTKETIQEDYKKLAKINENICVGYVGSKELCLSVLSELSKYLEIRYPHFRTDNRHYQLLLAFVLHLYYFTIPHATRGGVHSWVG